MRRYLNVRCVLVRYRRLDPENVVQRRQRPPHNLRSTIGDSTCSYTASSSLFMVVISIKLPKSGLDRKADDEFSLAQIVGPQR